MMRFQATIERVVSVLSMPLIWGALTGCQSAETSVVKMEPPVVSISAPMAHEVVDYDTFTGRTQALNAVEVRARVQGYLKEVRFQDGDLVKAGQVLFVIDPREYQAALDLARAKVEQAEAEVRLSTVERDRYRLLAQRDAGSRQDYDRALAALAVSEARKRAALADLEQARLDLEFTEVKSPIDGRVGRHLVDVGNLITPGNTESNLLTTVVSIDPMYVYFDVDERSLLRYQAMAREDEQSKPSKGPRDSVREARIPVEMGLADEAGYPHPGVLDFADNRVDPSTGTIQVRGVFPNSDGMLRPGLFARVRVAVSDPHSALLVTDRALGFDLNTPYLYVVDSENRVMRRVVSLGPVIEGMQVIREGLQPDDRVIVNGIQRVREGVEVDPQPVPMPISSDAETALAAMTDQTAIEPPPVPSPGAEVAAGMEPLPDEPAPETTAKPAPETESETETKSDSAPSPNRE